ncbi:MAG: DUF4338 domain-containing protein [Desulfosarcina sp.]|nr:DUF4338 domain-containing protein [Desulfobacterales bacterium]
MKSDVGYWRAMHEKAILREKILEQTVKKQEDKIRVAGTFYKAANWINVGQTRGRGKLGPPGKRSVPI